MRYSRGSTDVGRRSRRPQGVEPHAVFCEECTRLPDLDSNQEPAGSPLALVTQLDAHRDAKRGAHEAVHSDHDAVVTPMRLAVS